MSRKKFTEIDWHDEHPNGRILLHKRRKLEQKADGILSQN